MKKKLRIRDRKDFIRASKSGFYFRSDSVILQCGVTAFDHFRVGFTATKKIGNAVIRNRCKRRMRAASAIILSEIGVPGLDYVFIARKSLFFTDWNTLLENIRLSVMFLNGKIQK